MPTTKSTATQWADLARLATRQLSKHASRGTSNADCPKCRSVSRTEILQINGALQKAITGLENEAERA